MSGVTGIVGNVKDLFALIANSETLEDAKNHANQGLQQVQDWLRVGEGAIDPWLVKWAKSGWSMPIAVGFGVALLAIGDVINAAHLIFGLLKFIF
jgi:hypothetical protein